MSNAVILPILRRAAVVALREIANGCADVLDEPRRIDRVSTIEARVGALAAVLGSIYQRDEAMRLNAGGKVVASEWGVSLTLADVDHVIEALTRSVTP